MGKEQIAERFLIIARVNQLSHARTVDALYVHLQRLGKRLRLEGAVVAGKETRVRRETVVYLHEADGHDAVEPGVCGLFHESVVAFVMSFL